MISDASKLALVGVAATLGILVGFRVSNNLESTMNAKPHTEAIMTEQRLLQEEQAANQLNSGSDTADVSVGPEPPKWQLVIENVICVPCAVPFSHESSGVGQFNSHTLQAAPIHFIHIRNAFKTLGWAETSDTRCSSTISRLDLILSLKGNC